MHKTPSSHHQRVSLIILGLAFLSCFAGQAGAAPSQLSADRALSRDPAVAEPAIAALRAAGQSGVDALRQTGPGLDDETRARWRRALDAVCAQYDCADSGLYWFTDFDAAREEARRSGKPILSLRLLGRLDEDVSCANSRFFRTALYPDPGVARLLRDRFVLHWSSERPVPVVRIDFGDGRSLAGTITGNSVHYVLDAGGQVLDALPGLYGAGLFTHRLRETADWFADLDRADGVSLKWARAVFHDRQLGRLEEEFAELALLPRILLAGSSADPSSAPAPAPAPAPEPTAAALRAMTKSTIEVPWVQALSLSSVTIDMSADTWRALAQQRPEQWRLSKESRRFLLRKHGAGDPDVGRRVLAAFEDTLSIDTMRNEYQLHAEVHRWLGDPGADDDFEVVNARIYTELFLTPASDPWLGLSSPDTYLALDRDWSETDRGR